MAQQLTCDMCQQEAAVMIQTNLGDGSALTVGPACLVPYFIATARQMAEQAGVDLAAPGPQTPADGPEAPGPAQETGPRSKAASGAPVDAWVADAAALREASPGVTYTATEHMHDCPKVGAFLHKHAKGAQPHDHECEHEGASVGDGGQDGADA